VERRELLKSIAAAGLASLLGPAGLLAGGAPAHSRAASGGDAPPREPAAGSGAAAADSSTSVKPPPDLAVARSRKPAELVEAAIAALGGMSLFVSRGDHVLVKPNMGWDRTPEQAANTNPTVVRTLVDLCFKAGAKKVLVMDNTCNQARRCYARSGIARAAEEAGATVRHTNDKRLKEMPVGGEAVKKWPVYADFVEVDKLINVPVAKHHSLARLTLSMKNWLGAIGGRRYQLHQRLDDACVDLSSFFGPALIVLDAVRILKANGPQGGNLEDVERRDTVAAGTDEVAVDAFGATLFGLKPEEIGCVRRGAERGYGVADLSRLRIAEV